MPVVYVANLLRLANRGEPGDAPVRWSQPSDAPPENPNINDQFRAFGRDWPNRSSAPPMLATGAISRMKLKLSFL